MSPATPRTTTHALRSVLVPIDLSPLSDRVARRAASLPVAAGGTITLFHVVAKSLPSRARRQAEKDARVELARAASRAAKEVGAGVSIKHAVGVGAAAAEIAARAERLGADLVVMGRGAARPLRDSFLGSTAERVIRQGRMPVLVVRSPVRAPYQRPALGLDLDGAAKPLLAMLLRVIRSPLPPVTVVHAYDAPYLGMVQGQMSADEAEQEDRRRRRTAAAEVAAVVARALAAETRELDGASGIKTYVRHGDARSVIKAAANKLDADLLLLGTHGYAGVARVFLGTVAGDVLRDVRCDVLVVPPRRTASR